ncbi:MAG: hypothetical protein JSW58_08410 [Candidatus Latescibacterota bacterium]|nr:MAG: hypothetical protein JSW58_08410 [Candidatus Latescibacterota bacterium]
MDARRNRQAGYSDFDLAKHERFDERFDNGKLLTELEPFFDAINDREYDGELEPFDFSINNGKLEPFFDSFDESIDDAKYDREHDGKFFAIDLGNDDGLDSIDDK